MRNFFLEITFLTASYQSVPSKCSIIQNILKVINEIIKTMKFVLKKPQEKDKPVFKAIFMISKIFYL